MLLEKRKTMTINILIAAQNHPKIHNCKTLKIGAALLESIKVLKINISLLYLSYLIIYIIQN